MKPAGGAAVAAGAGGGNGQRCAAARGDAERTAAHRAVLIMAGLYINVFGLRLVARHGARIKAPETGPYTIMRVMASQVVLLVVRHAKFVEIITSRHMIEIKRRIIMF